MKGFAAYVMGCIDDVEQEIALDLSPANISRDEQIEKELFNLLPEKATKDTKEAIRELLELL